MKAREKKRAIELRKRGYSINHIYKTLGVAKGSVSVWVRDVELAEPQRKYLSRKGYTKEAVEKRRKVRLENESKKRQAVIDKAYSDIKNINSKNLFFIGIALYWAEGSKSKRGNVEFSNSDPRMIKIMMEFFKKVCETPREKFRGHVYLHPHLSKRSAEKYWSNVSGIPKDQFFKTSQQHNKASKNKKDCLPYGTFSINIGDTKLFLKIKGWIEATHDRVMRT